MGNAIDIGNALVLVKLQQTFQNVESLVFPFGIDPLQNVQCTLHAHQLSAILGVKHAHMRRVHDVFTPHLRTMQVYNLHHFEGVHSSYERFDIQNGGQETCMWVRSALCTGSIQV